MTDREILISLMENSKDEFLSNWGTDTPIDEWEGVTTNEKGCVIGLELECDSLTSLPESIGNLKKLTEFYLTCDSLT